MLEHRPRSTRLITRPGARFQCFGDGLCCTDAHVLGPVSPLEARALKRLDARSVTQNRELAIRALRTTSEGRCGYLDSNYRCTIHAHSAKPQTCRRYPFFVIETPDGARVSTDHRCPCRTMGNRPILTPEWAQDSLRDAKGELDLDRKLDAPIELAPGMPVSWQAWREHEDRLLAALAQQRPEEVLGGELFPTFDPAQPSWLQFARAGLNDQPMRWARAMEWSARALLSLLGVSSRPPDPPRPWSDAFDRAEARSPPGDPGAMLCDAIADAIWSLEWVDRGSFAAAQCELLSRVALIRRIHERLMAAEARPDRAMAEAIAIVEINALSDEWQDRFCEPLPD